MIFFESGMSGFFRAIKCEATLRAITILRSKFPRKGVYAKVEMGGGGQGKEGNWFGVTLFYRYQWEEYTAQCGSTVYRVWSKGRLVYLLGGLGLPKRVYTYLYSLNLVYCYCY